MPPLFRPTKKENVLKGVNLLVDQLERGELEKVKNADHATNSDNSTNAGTLDGIDSLGFLRLAALADRRISFGTGTFTWAGNTQSQLLNIVHGLGRTPVVIICTPGGAMTSVAGPAIATGGVDANNFNVIATDCAGVARSTTCGFYWLVIG